MDLQGQLVQSPVWEHDVVFLWHPKHMSFKPLLDNLCEGPVPPRSSFQYPIVLTVRIFSPEIFIKSDLFQLKSTVIFCSKDE